MHLALLPAPGGDKLPSPSIKHLSSCSNWDPWTTAWAVSHLLSCWYHSNDSLGKINQIFWKALYPLLRCVTDVRQPWLYLSPWRMVGCRTWMDASVLAETACRDKHGPFNVQYVQQWWKENVLKYYKCIGSLLVLKKVCGPIRIRQYWIKIWWLLVDCLFMLPGHYQSNLLKPYPHRHDETNRLAEFSTRTHSYTTQQVASDSQNDIFDLLFTAARWPF